MQSEPRWTTTRTSSSAGPASPDWRRARARRLGSAGAARRPLRDRRAPDLGLRGADRVADRDGRRGIDQADLRRSGHPHPARDDPHAPALDVLDLRLPGALRGPVRGLRRRVRDGEGRRAGTGQRPSTRTGATSRRPSWSTRSAGGASSDTATSHPTRRSRAGSRSTPAESRTNSRSGSTATTSPPATAGAFRPRDEVRVGVGSFDPRFHVKDPTVRLASDLERDAVRYQGNWIPHKLRRATEGGVFFVGDSAGHCLPLTAEGIRTAFYFGIACGRELRRVVDGQRHARDGAAALRGLLSATRVALPMAASGPTADPPGASAAPGAGAPRDEPRPVPATGRSATTCGSPIPPTPASSPPGGSRADDRRKLAA